MSDWEPTDAPPPVDELEVDELETLAHLTHPARGPIFRWLHSPHSAAELAERMNTPVTRLYHHLNRLEADGLIHVVATRRSGATTERRYQVVARHFQLSRRRFAEYDARELAAAMGSMFDFAKLRLQREIELGTLSTDTDRHDSFLALQELRLPPGRAEEFAGRLRALVDEFAADDEEGPDNVALFITTHHISA